MSNLPITGCLEKYIQEASGQTINNDNNVILQISAIKLKDNKLTGAASDGTTKFPTIIQASPPPQENQIIKLTSFSVMQGKKYLQIYNYQLVANHNGIIGTPTYHPFFQQQQQQQQQQRQQQQQQQHQQQPTQMQLNIQNQINSNQQPYNNYNNNNNYQPQRGGQAAPPSSKSNSNMTIFDIDSLNTSMTESFTICAVVRSKSDIKSWENISTKGQLFSVELADESQSTKNVIKATFFGAEQCNLFYPQLIEGQTYYITCPSTSIKQANSKFNKTKHNFELILGQHTVIKPADPVHAFSKASTLKFQFWAIDNLQNVLDSSSNSAIVDVLGRIEKVSNVEPITSKDKTKQLEKLTVTIQDNSGSGIDVAFWNDDAKKFVTQLAPNQIIAIKNAKLSKYNGYSLSYSFGSEILIDPNHLPECQALRNYFNSNVGLQINSLTQEFKPAAGSKPTTTVTISDLIGFQNLGMPDSDVNYTVNAFIHRNVFGKLSKQEDKPSYCYIGCSKCFKKQCPNQCGAMAPLWKLPVKISDSTGTINSDLFNVAAKSVLGECVLCDSMDDREFLKFLDDRLDFDGTMVVKHTAKLSELTEQLIHHFTIVSINKTESKDLKNLTIDLANSLNLLVESNDS